MNTVIQTILSRRSCRSFTEASVQTEDVKTLLACAAAAPSGRNQQLGQFTALTDRNKIQKLAAAVGKALGRENYDMYNPAVLIITSNDKTNVFREVDNACAMENIYLASEALGLSAGTDAAERIRYSGKSRRLRLRRCRLPRRPAIRKRKQNSHENCRLNRTYLSSPEQKTASAAVRRIRRNKFPAMFPKAVNRL